MQQAVLPGMPVPVSTAKLARVTQFQMEVAEPLKTMIRSAFKASDGLKQPSDAPSQTSVINTRIYAFNLQQQQVSWLVLLDLADYLQAYLSDLWQVVLTPAQRVHAYRRPLY